MSGRINGPSKVHDTHMGFSRQTVNRFVPYLTRQHGRWCCTEATVPTYEPALSPRSQFFFFFFFSCSFSFSTPLAFLMFFAVFILAVSTCICFVSTDRHTNSHIC